MKFVEREFIPVMLGSDINTYSMARAFYEAYGTKAIVIGKSSTGPSCNSKIIDFRADPQLDKQETFVRVINSLAQQFADKKLLVIGCGDSYVELIIKNKALLRENIIAPYVDEDMMNSLLTKEKFYEMCDQYHVEYPGTLQVTRATKDNFTLPFGFPVILKPSNGIEYWAHEFPGQKKVYKLNHLEELKQVVQQIYAAGYDDKLTIQDFIPGDDSFLRVMIGFCGKDKKVKLMAQAHVMLEEHTPHGLGNTAVLMNEYNEPLALSLKNFLESIGFVGFFTFDIKFDQRDGTYKILEINLRQGRSNFYVTGAGYNLARYVVDEFIYGKKLDFEIARTENLWTVIPMHVAFKYVKDKAYIAKMKELIKAGSVVNPLFLKGDTGLKRMSYLYKSHLSHFIKFRKYYK